jgi:glutathione S-transferase
MKSYALVGIVTLLSLLLYLYMGIRVGQGRSKYGVEAPAIQGHPDFDRLFRVQANTLEWLPIYLVSLWLFALYWDSRVAAGLGVVWIVGRTLYMTGYSRAAGARSTGFMIQMAATGILLLGALGRLAWIMVAPTPT